MAATDDYDEIAKVIATYIEGAKTGNVGLLLHIFHEKARSFGEGPPPGKRWDLDMEEYTKMQEEEPLNKDGKYRARLVSVKQMGQSATAVVEEDGCWGKFSFVQIFSLSRIDGAWKIVNKTYTHRGGGDPTSIKPPEKRPDMSWRDHLVMLLTFGATAEHCLMVQYLYAAYSLKVESNETPRLRKMIESWRHNLLAVAREEMGHLLTVQNLLLLLGAPAALARDSSVWAQNYYPYPFSLDPLTLDTLACFVYAEMPDIDPDTDIDDAELKALLKDVIARVEKRLNDPHHRLPDGRVMLLDAHRVGALYQQIIDVIGNPKLIPDSAFDESSYEFQASWDQWGRGYRPAPYRLDAEGNKAEDDDPDEPAAARKIKAPGKTRAARKIEVGDDDGSYVVRLGSSQAIAESFVRVDRAATRTDAVEALHRIAKQGEAQHLGLNKRLKSSAESELSHFDRFIAVYKELKAEIDKNAGWSPAKGVCSNPTTRHAPPPLEPKYSQLESVVAKRLGQMFNIRYRLLLNYLGHFFQLAKTQPVDRPNVRALLMHRVFGEMYNIKTLAGLLVRTPISEEPDSRWAGPPFEMPYSFTLPDADADVWRQHHELIGTSLKACKKLFEAASMPGPVGRTVKDHLAAATGAEAYLLALQDLDLQTQDWFEAVLASEGAKPAPRDHRFGVALPRQSPKGAARS
ncbi:MAG: nuclear transport factor 2 family protein [Hyphomicrobiales bacterium]|nr:nuclear transport factor 2 family protein [Hyphomicrobiales bacterium]MBV8439847.1 nuclear transport factor 2 family protein [Hyphomicrobiales bacterium]